MASFSLRRPVPSLVILSLVALQTSAQTVVTELDPNEVRGKRPYEMVEANRVEPGPVSLTFDNLRGWRMRVSGGAEAVFQLTRAQDLWGRPVARLRYRRTGAGSTSPTVTLIPPWGIMLPRGADAVDLWIYGNRWEWENPPDTPPVEIHLRLRDAAGKPYDTEVESVRWKDWWLVHYPLPKWLKFPALLEAIEVQGGTQPEWREIYFDSIRFYRELWPQLDFRPRPQRNLTLADGQLPGANTGPGRLEFPTREETILPAQLGGEFRNEVSNAGRDVYIFKYTGGDCAIAYYFEAVRGLAGIRALVDNAPVGNVMDGGGVRIPNTRLRPALIDAGLGQSVVRARYTDGTELTLQIWQKSLVIDVANRGRAAKELAFGQISGAVQPRIVRIPYITFGGSNPSVALSIAEKRYVFTSLWADWYRSNGSELYGGEGTGTGFARINGGVRYVVRTDGRANPMCERLFLTVSPRIEEVLPTIANPVGLHAAQAMDRVFQNSFGPSDYNKAMLGGRRLRAYGIKKLIQYNTDLTWRDGGESFTLRDKAAPGKGGDEGLKKYVAHQRSLGWLCGLYTNYADLSPVNPHWGPSYVQRASGGTWRPSWPGCYALKPLWAAEFEARLAPRIKEKFGPNAAYTDVHTAAAPWAYNDYDARVPGAATFAQTFYAYGEILRNESRIYEGPVFSEGTYQWLYAGLSDGNYAQAYTKRPLAREPLLPVFDLYQIHTKECDVGMGQLTTFWRGVPKWDAAENLDRSIDRFLLHTLAYGHIGWLVEDKYRIARTCRSYYMLQQVQARYGLKAPTRLEYWDGKKLWRVSEAVVLNLPAERRQLYIEYPGGLSLWLNDHPKENWEVEVAAQKLILPPAGWAVWQSDGSLLSWSALQGNGKADYLRSDSYVYLDGRGQNLSVADAACDGALAITPLSANALQIVHISGDGPFVVRRPYGMKGKATKCEAYNFEGKPRPSPRIEDDGRETRITPSSGAMRYVLHF